MQNIHIIGKNIANSYANIIYHYDKCTDCLLSLQIVQNFYTSQSLGGFADPPCPPLNDATVSECDCEVGLLYMLAVSNRLIVEQL